MQREKQIGMAGKPERVLGTPAKDQSAGQRKYDYKDEVSLPHSRANQGERKRVGDNGAGIADGIDALDRAGKA